MSESPGVIGLHATGVREKKPQKKPIYPERKTTPKRTKKVKSKKKKKKK